MEPGGQEGQIHTCHLKVSDAWDRKTVLNERTRDSESADGHARRLIYSLISVFLCITVHVSFVVIVVGKLPTYTSVIY